VIVKKISKQVAELYESGKSLTTIAEELDIAYRTARKALWAEGLEIRTPTDRLKGRTRPVKVVAGE